ncbi:integrase, partial [Burkholderia sp. SIMBA_045]
AGTEWDLANHQCRRTFAYNVANSRLGRMGLVFLKWQLKHASMSWTQLYAASPYQDHALYREFEEEMFEARLGLLEGWAHPDALLSGGAGKKIMQTRARAARDLKQLLRQTAESVELRSTGHAWCISGTRG